MADVVINFDSNADALKRDLEGVAGSSDSAASSLRGLKRSSSDSTEQLEGLKFAAAGAGGKIGEVAGRIENAGRAMSAFASNPVALATAAVVGLGAASLVTGAAVAAAFVGITQAADEARESLEPFREEGLGLDEEDTAAVLGAAAALEAVSLVAKQLTSEIGAELAPTVEEVSVMLVAMGLTAIDVFNGMADGADLGREFLIRLIEFGVNPLNASVLTAAEGAAVLARALGKPLEAVEEWTEKQREAQTAVSLVGGATDRLNLALGDNVNLARSLVDAVALERAEREAVTKVIDKQREAVLSLNGLLGETIDISHSAFMGARVDVSEANDELERMFRQLNQTEKFDKLGESMGKAGRAAGEGFEFASNVVQLFGKDADKTAKKVFAVNKAAAMVDIALKTGQAIMANLAIGPPGIPLAIAAGAMGAVQFGLAASQQFEGASTPSVGGGGAVAGGGGGGGDTSPAIISGAHGSRTPAPVAGQTTRSAQVQWDHRVIDIIAADTYPGSAFDPTQNASGQRRSA